MEEGDELTIAEREALVRLRAGEATLSYRQGLARLALAIEDLRKSQHLMNGGIIDESRT